MRRSYLLVTLKLQIEDSAFPQGLHGDGFACKKVHLRALAYVAQEKFQPKFEAKLYISHMRHFDWPVMMTGLAYVHSSAINNFCRIFEQF